LRWEFPCGPPFIGDYTTVDHLDHHGACIDDHDSKSACHDCRFDSGRSLSEP